jgi:hypothetical protein
MNKKELEAEFTTTLDGFIDLVAALPAKQINIAPPDGGWTAGELARHVTLATQDDPGIKTKKTDRPYDKWVEDIKKVFLDHKAKYQAPEFIVPEKKAYEKADILEQLNKNKKDHLASIREKDLTELTVDIELPDWGHLTRYEWIKLMIYHVQRHTKQFREKFTAKTESVQ